MGHIITLMPSGHRFEAEPHESVLEAALRSGLNLRYSCTSGTCGECKGRVLSGVVAEERFHDYPLTEAERLQGTVLLCSVTAGSDLTVEAEEVTDRSQIPRQRIDGKVWRLESAGPDYRLLQVRTPRSRTLRFAAGQQVRLTADAGSWCGAVASCPCNGMVLQFHLARDDEQPFLRHAFDGMQTGEQVRIDGPFGAFALDESARRPMLFVAWSTGLAPAKSLIEHAVSLEAGVPMTLLWAAPPGGHYLENYLRSIADAVDEFGYRLFDGEGDWAMIAGEISDPAGIDLYVAGPQAFNASVAQAFTASGVPAQRIFRFTTDEGVCRN